jgi:cell volume regulation protein A
LLSEIIVSEDSRAIGQKLVDLSIPKTSVISFIQRRDIYFTPNGSTMLEPNDKLFVISESPEDVSRISECVGSKIPA